MPPGAEGFRPGARAAKSYNPVVKVEHIPYAELDKKWQDRWEADGVFRAPKSPRPGRKFYCLDMFPYPSAAGLHVGHP